MKHELKTDPETFEATWVGKKLFEIRKDDRGFGEGDMLLLRETRYSGRDMNESVGVIHAKPLEYTGREIECVVTYRLTGYGLGVGWCILGIHGLARTSHGNMVVTAARTRDPMYRVTFGGGGASGLAPVAAGGGASGWHIHPAVTVPRCKGTNCDAAEGEAHSPERMNEHARMATGADRHTEGDAKATAAFAIVQALGYKWVDEVWAIDTLRSDALACMAGKWPFSPDNAVQLKATTVPHPETETLYVIADSSYNATNSSGTFGAVPINAKAASNSGGHRVSYYAVDVLHTTKGGPLYRAEAMDIVDALDTTFAEGEAFKAIWRCAADRIGAHKEGNDTRRDAEKVVYYGEQMLAREQRRHPK